MNSLATLHETVLCRSQKTVKRLQIIKSKRVYCYTYVSVMQQVFNPNKFDQFSIYSLGIDSLMAIPGLPNVPRFDPWPALLGFFNQGADEM